MTDREKAIVMAHTGICMLTGDKFRIFHKYVEDIMGRPIWTHDIGFLENEIKEKSKDDFIALCADEDGCVNYKNKCGDLISREETLTAFADYVGSGMSMNDYDALWDIVAKMPAVKQEPKFIAKSDGTIEQIKNCNDCLFKKEWEKIGKLLSNILEKHTEQEPCEDAISRQAVLDKKELVELEDGQSFYCISPEDVETLQPVTPQPKTGQWINIDETHSKCDRCGAVFEISSENGEVNYCPNCGAMMVEPQESEKISDRNMKMWEEIFKAESEE